MMALIETLGKFFDAWMHRQWGSNRAEEWLLAVGAAVGVALASRVLQGLVVARLAKAATRTATQVDDVVVSVLAGTKSTFHLALGVLLARNLVQLNPGAQQLVLVVLTSVFTLQFGIWVQRALVGAIALWAQGREGNQDVTMAAGLTFLARLTIWTLVALVALSNLGVELSAVITGLGVGGVAAALAVQSTLGDLIAGVSMYFDRPFDIGDFIVVGENRGTVFKIGIRTTRLVSLDGEELVLANGEIGRARIRNFARMKERRVLFNFGIEYNLPTEKLERTIELVREVVGDREGVRLERAHFKAFGASSLDFEVVYYVLSADYAVYMDCQQVINLELYRALGREGIPFAFPTRTVHLRQDI